MCYFLYIASPLTLSEVRSMLPHGLVADLADSADHQALKSLHPKAQTVARLLAGRCSCDLIRARSTDPKEDERHLRERYRRLEIPRSEIIAALERHRRGSEVQGARADWLPELSKFVAEHARNAGPTLYYLHFSPAAATLEVPRDTRTIGTASLTSAPDQWLQEELPILVTR